MDAMKKKSFIVARKADGIKKKWNKWERLKDGGYNGWKMTDRPTGSRPNQMKRKQREVRREVCPRYL